MDDRPSTNDGASGPVGASAAEAVATSPEGEPAHTAWWSRPAEPVDGAQPYSRPDYGRPADSRPADEQPSYAEQPAYSQQPAYGEQPVHGGYGPPSGAPAYSQQGQAQPGWREQVDQQAPGQQPAAPVADPYAQPYGQAPFGAAPVRDTAGDTPWATSWGTPDPGAGRRRRGGRAGLAVAALLAAGLLGGVTGGVVVAARDRGGSLTDPSATLGAGSSASTTVERAPDSVAGIAGRVLRSTVSISVRSGSTGGSGSGVVLRSDGYVLTNNHVVAAAATGGTITVTVNGSEGRELPAQIVGRDPETDLAVLKVTGSSSLTPATLGRSADLVVGDPVVAIGSPLGLNGTVTTGIISALNRTVNVPAEGGGRATPLLNAIQTDAAINPGNSGGALVDLEGAVIGINSAIATLGGGSATGDQSGSIGVGFAIPVDEARSVAEEIIRTGKATHPAVGVEAGNEVADDGTKQGARVSRVVAGGPAAVAGLQVGDVISKVGDTRVGSVDELILALRQSRVGDRVTVTYSRSGQERTAPVVLADKGN